MRALLLLTVSLACACCSRVVIDQYYANIDLTATGDDLKVRLKASNSRIS